MLDLHRLSLLRELSLRGTITAVASTTGLSASAISQHLSTLEREAGVTLLRRSGRVLTLTPAAERLVHRTEELLATMERAEAELADATGRAHGTVRLAIFQSASLALLPGALLHLRSRHPDVRVVATQREPAAALDDTWARDVDLVVAEEYPHHSAPHYPGIERVPLTHDEILLGVGHGLGIDALSQAANMPWVMEPRGAASRHFAEQQCRLAGFEPDVRFETTDLQTHAQLVESGLAVALIPGLMWRGRGIDAAARRLPERPHRTVFTAARTSSRRSAAVSAVRAALLQAAQDLTP
ncbi:LysR family transcriptional regulator [Demequina sp.]|uniref:LysR family transcriptional regulator n=1 Tax=Demequina sp. TaxID=2050685 RepID=UPI003D0A1E40